MSSAMNHEDGHLLACLLLDCCCTWSQDSTRFQIYRLFFKNQDCMTRLSSSPSFPSFAKESVGKKLAAEPTKDALPE